MLIILVASLLLLTALSEQLDLVVDLPEGTIQGFPIVSRNGQEFAAFEGIPYGEKPERFQPAVPKVGWEGMLDCTSPGAMCSQPQDGTVGEQGYFGDEDCLYLNTYTAVDLEEV